MVWIDQPVGTGFSPGVPDINDEQDVAEQFMGFWRNFMETFSMEGRKVYITGESYAGQYIPYIASGMLDTNDTKYYNVKGIQINDPSINEDDTMIYGTSAPPPMESLDDLSPRVHANMPRSAFCPRPQLLRPDLQPQRDVHGRAEPARPGLRLL